MDGVTLQKLLKDASGHIVQNMSSRHLKNINELTLDKLNVNPFLINYLAVVIDGEVTPKSLAKALVYPRVFGTSVSTTFGNVMQDLFVLFKEYFESEGAITSGVDITFIDSIDNRKKYCQVKSGPQTINKDDIETIRRHFRNAKNLARANRLRITDDDLILGVLYGTPEELNAHYRKLAEDHPVYIGKEFWHRLTGDENFYGRLIKAVVKATEEIDPEDVVADAVERISEEIKADARFVF